ncbi:hypothetical protein Tco_0659783 [Tanacetum coccineum]
MVGRSLNVDNDPFCPYEKDEDVLVNLLARLSSSLTKRHWNRIKHIFQYLRGTTSLGLFYSNNSKQGLVGYAYVGYLFDPHKAISQIGYVFLIGCTAISWCCQKQTLLETSSNHVEVITLCEATRECVWLRSMTQRIMTSCRLKKEKGPTLIYADNAAYVAQMKECYIKSDRLKHIPPRHFAYTQDLIKDNQIEIKYFKSSNISAYLFTKAL